MTEGSEPKGASANADMVVEPQDAANDGDSTADSSQDIEDKARVLKQIEFYFTDSNLPYDRFMWQLHTANAEHWVPIATMASFKRTREFQGKGLPWLADALRTSESLLEVDETGTKVRRRGEVQEPKGALARSVYAKGFGEETLGLQRQLEDFFEKYGRINVVRMRRMHHTKDFKGSVFCEFADFDDVQKFLEADPKPQWNGNELLIMSKLAYCEMKMKEKGLTGIDSIIQDSEARKFDAFRSMDRPQKKEKGKKTEFQEKPEIYLEFMGKRLKVNEEGGGSVVEADVPFTKGASLKFSGCGGELSFRDIKEPLKDHFEKSPYVKHIRGQDWGLVGFEKTLSAEDIALVRKQLETVGGDTFTWEVADEDTEKAFQIERAKIAARRIVASGASNRGGDGGHGGRGKRGGRGGRGRGRGRGGRGRGGGRDGRRDGESSGSKEATEDSAAAVGEKRKRAVEPDGGPDTKGQGVPVIQTSKKAKTDTNETGADGS